MSTKNQPVKKKSKQKNPTTGQEEKPKNNSVQQWELCASMENQVPEASKGHGLQSGVGSFTTRSFKCQELLEQDMTRKWHKQQLSSVGLI